VPNGAAISEAHVLFSVDEVRPGQSDVDVTVSIYGQLSANAAKPSATGGDLSSRPATSAAVMWKPPASISINDELATPNIASVVQEIVSLSDWASGNSMGILFGHVSSLYRSKYSPPIGPQ
jgi:hypothetical protein